MDYSAVPSAIFTGPEIGCVGLSESQARGKICQCGMRHNAGPRTGQGPGHGRAAGLFSRLSRMATTARFSESSFAGANASDILAEATLAINAAVSLEGLASTIHAHPTLAEGMGKGYARGALISCKGGK